MGFTPAGKSETAASSQIRLAEEERRPETASVINPRSARSAVTDPTSIRHGAWMWILLAALGFGGGFPLSKALLDSGVDVWQFFVPRFVIATAVVLLFATKRSLRLGSARTRGMALGVVNVAIPTVLLTYATDLLPASVAGILVAFVPVATIAFAHVVVPGERFAFRRVPGLTVAVAGAAILVTGSRTPDGVSLSTLGITMGVLGVAAAGLGGAVNRRYAMRTPAIELAAPQFVAASVVLVAVAAPAGGLQLGGFDAVQWLGLVLMAIVSTALPFYSLLKAAETASAATVSNVGYLAPIVAAVGAIVFLGDPVTAAFTTGAALILVGVWLSDALAAASPVPPS